MTSRTRSVRARLLAVATGLVAGAVVASGATPTPATAAPAAPAAQSSRHAYTPGSQDDAQNSRLRRQLAQALKAQANQPRATPRSGRQTAAAAVVY
ncbi:MAG TPA: hypothetical protein VHO27_02620 [Angustibacter sp.]|nr:hypothetical protein [Angustibacter sp.]